MSGAPSFAPPGCARAMASPVPRALRPRSAGPCSAGSLRSPKKSPAKSLQRTSGSKGSHRDLRSALQQVDVGRTRGDFCAERFRVDCGRLEEELQRARKALRDLQDQFVDILESKEQPHYAWLSLWHQRLLQAVADAEQTRTARSSLSVPGWKDFKQLVLKSTEEVVESQQLIEEKVKALRSQQGDQKIQAEVLQRRKELAEVLAQRKSCAEEVHRKKLQRQKLQQEMAEEDQRWSREKTTLLKRREEVEMKVEELTESYDTSYRSCVMMRDEMLELRKMRRPMPLHVYKLRMERLKAELMERQGPLMALEQVQRSEEVDQQARHFKEMEELRAVQVSLRKHLAQVEDHRRSAACRPIQQFWRKRKRRQEVAKRRRYFEQLEQGVDPLETSDPSRLRPQGPLSASPVESIDDESASTDLAEDLFGDVREQICAELEDPRLSHFTEENPMDALGTPAAKSDSPEDSPSGKSQLTEQSATDDEVEEAPLDREDLDIAQSDYPDSPGEMSPLTEKSSVDDDVEDAWLDVEKRRKPALPYADDDMVAVKSDTPEDSGAKLHTEESPKRDAVEAASVDKVSGKDQPRPSEDVVNDSPGDSPGGTSQLTEKSSVHDDIEEDDMVSPETTGADEEQRRPHIVPKIALHPPDEAGVAGDGEGGLTSPELPGEFLSMTFTSVDGARGVMEDSLLLTEDSPCSPDRFAAELASDEERGIDLGDKTSGSLCSERVMATLRYLNTFIDEEPVEAFTGRMHRSKSWPQRGGQICPTVETIHAVNHVAELQGIWSAPFRGRLPMPASATDESETDMTMTISTSHNGSVEEATQESTEPIDLQAPLAAIPVPPPGSGSRGHPVLCRRPCIRFANGSCKSGDACAYCHYEHDYRTNLLDRRQRLQLKSMDTSELLAVLLPHVRHSLEIAQIESSDFIVMLEGEVGSTRAPNVDNFLFRTLSRMPLSGLLGLIMGREAFQPVLQEQVEVLRERFEMNKK
eukprot:s51_g3.t2